MTTCTGCHYWRGLGGYNRWIKACHYALDNFPHTRAHDGHTEPASECTHRKEEDQMITKIDHERALKMVGTGATLKEMAAALKQNAASEAGTPDAAQGK